MSELILGNSERISNHLSSYTVETVGTTTMISFDKDADRGIDNNHLIKYEVNGTQTNKVAITCIFNGDFSAHNGDGIITNTNSVDDATNSGFAFNISADSKDFFVVMKKDGIAVKVFKSVVNGNMPVANMYPPFNITKGNVRGTVSKIKTILNSKTVRVVTTLDDNDFGHGLKKGDTVRFSRRSGDGTPSDKIINGITFKYMEAYEVNKVFTDTEFELIMTSSATSTGTKINLGYFCYQIDQHLALLFSRENDADDWKVTLFDITKNNILLKNTFDSAINFTDNSVGVFVQGSSSLYKDLKIGSDDYYNEVTGMINNASTLSVTTGTGGFGSTAVSEVAQLSEIEDKFIVSSINEGSFVYTGTTNVVDVKDEITDLNKIELADDINVGSITLEDEDGKEYVIEANSISESISYQKPSATLTEIADDRIEKALKVDGAISKNDIYIDHQSSNDKVISTVMNDATDDKGATVHTVDLNDCFQEVEDQLDLNTENIEENQNKIVTDVTLENTTLTIKTKDDNTFEVDLSSLASDVKLQSGTLDGSTLQLKLSTGGVIETDLSSLASDVKLSTVSISGTVVTLTLSDGTTKSFDIDSALTDIKERLVVVEEEQPVLKSDISTNSDNITEANESILENLEKMVNLEVSIVTLENQLEEANTEIASVKADLKEVKELIKKYGADVGALI